MKEERQEKLKISNDLLDAMLVGVKTQDDLGLSSKLCMRFFYDTFRL